MSNLDTFYQQQRSCKKCPHDTKLDITCGFKLIVTVLIYAGFLVSSVHCFLHRNGHESSWLFWLVFFFVSASQAKSDCRRTMLGMPLDLKTAWELQIRKDLFVSKHIPSSDEQKRDHFDLFENGSFRRAAQECAPS